MNPAPPLPNAAADATAASGWASAPTDVLQLLVFTIENSWPTHQAERSLAALRQCSWHYLTAIDAARRHWTAPPMASVDVVAAPLRRWVHLRQLELEGIQLGFPVLDALVACRHLEKLQLKSCALTSSHVFATLAHLPLRHLSMELDGGLPSGASLAALKICAPVLTALDLSQSVGEVVQAATGLRHLGLNRAIRTVAMQAQQPFDIGQYGSQLISLMLRSSFTTDEAFLQLFNRLSSLERLEISGSRNLTDGGLRGVTSLAASLTGLVLQGGHGVSQDGATALALLTNLRFLDLAYSNAMSGDATLPMIAGACQQLTEIDVRGCPRACAPAAFSHLSRLRRLQRLSAQGCCLQPDAVAILSAITTLTFLDMADNPLIGSLNELHSLRALAYLDVSECALADDHLVTLLASLPQIRTLIVGANPLLTGHVVEALAAGPPRTSLETLVVSGLQLEQEMLEVVPQLSTLCYLDVSGNSPPLAPNNLLAAAQASTSLHTLVCYGMKESGASKHDLLNLRNAASGFSQLRILL